MLLKSDEQQQIANGLQQPGAAMPHSIKVNDYISKMRQNATTPVQR